MSHSASAPPNVNEEVRARVELSGTIQQSGRAYAVTPPLTARVGASVEERTRHGLETSTMRYTRQMGCSVRTTKTNRVLRNVRALTLMVS
jgi:hypothetical protein